MRYVAALSLFVAAAGVVQSQDPIPPKKDATPIQILEPAKNELPPKPQSIGLPFGPEFRELAPKNAYLIGLELGLSAESGRDVIRSVRAIYLLGDREILGEKRGTATGKTITVRGKPGYGIGAFVVKSALEIQGMSVTFMKLAAGKFDPADSYASEWVGTNPVTESAKIDGHGFAIVGLTGRADEKNLIALGPVFRGQEIGLGPIPPSDTHRTQIVADLSHPEFQDVAPKGGLLVGFEFGLAHDHEVHVAAVRAIYQTGDKVEFGAPFGTNNRRPVKVVAKPGYAVGGISCKSGRGFSITFMKIHGDKLDTRDSYESEWIGADRGFKHKLGGGGSHVVGIVGTTDSKDIFGLGLVVKGPDPIGGNASQPVVRKLGPAPEAVGYGVGAEFYESAPRDGFLVGLELGMPEEGLQRIISCRPIYRIDGKEQLGEQRGEPIKTVFTIKAKEGYAIGSMMILSRGGAGVGGLSVTFMKIKDGKLDPADSYASDWIGTSLRTLPTKIDGGGLQILGIVGRTSDGRLNSLGPVFQGQSPVAKKKR